MKNATHTLPSLTLGAVTLLALAGCSTLAPQYEKPAIPVAATLPTGPAYQQNGAGASTQAIADIPWQSFFLEEKLRGLIELTLKNNRDLRIAVLNIERTQAQYQIQSSDQFPKINAVAAASVQQTPQTLSASGHPVTNSQYSVGLGLLSYELDMFGRVQSLKAQALEQFLATEQARRTVQISLVAQVATQYLSLAADQERLTLAKETLRSQQDSFQLIKRRFDAGISSDLDLQQARTSVDGARVDIARYTTLVAQDENALSLLVGSPLPTNLLPTSLTADASPLKEIPSGLSSEVLLQRPDILQAEHQLKGANANIGAARASRFPRISLVSSVGYGSSELSGLFKGGAFAWGISPSLSLPIFDGGSSKATVKISEIDRDVLVAQYEKAIQTAFREVADALAQRGTIEELLSAQQSLTDASAQRHHLSEARFERGIDSHLNVLDAQRSLYAAQQGLIEVRLTKAKNLVTLYKVVGGGDSK